MKLKNITNQAVSYFDELAGRGGSVEPGQETFDLSEQAARELSTLTHLWVPVETAPVRTSGIKKGKG